MAAQHHLAPLIFPSFEMKISHEGNATKIYDVVRKAYVVLTPEEWVRQHCLHWLVSLGYPLGRCSIERMLKHGGLRYDLLWHDAHLHPYLLIECKAPSVKITDDTLRQTAWYNMQLKAPYILLTNGNVAYCAQMLADGSLKQLDDVPHYSNA
ncbi:MAG: type I restriction enzyme HsdR N-terminal domain-containing protein [Ignavibacteria bacterium]|jgi:hypothetical protein